MATRQIVDHTCDECADKGKMVTEEVDSLEFSWGKALVIDLCPTHRAKFVKMIGGYAALATPVATQPNARSGRAGKAVVRMRHVETPVNRRAIVEWGKARGLEISMRGRVAADIMEQYREWDKASR